MFEKLRSYFKRGMEVAPEHNERIRRLQEITGLEIHNPSLYVRALRHRSILANENYTPTDSYERLEFLGDAVLDLVITEIIFDHFPAGDEGFLTKLRAKLVKGDVLADYSRDLKLSSMLVVGERAQGQGIEFSKSVLADVFEALIGAIYLDKGYRDTYRFVEKVIDRNIDFNKVINTLDNFKSLLLEYCQANKLSIPEYEVVSEYGPGHDKTFEIRVLVEGEEKGRGTGKNKKEAEQMAARLALRKMGE